MSGSMPSVPGSPLGLNIYKRNISRHTVDLAYNVLIETGYFCPLYAMSVIRMYMIVISVRRDPDFQIQYVIGECPVNASPLYARSTVLHIGRVCQLSSHSLKS